MKPRVFIFAALAIVIALGTAHVARNWLAEQRAALDAEKKPAKEAPYVLVAAKDLPTGSFIRVEDLRWQPWPSDELSDNYLTKDNETPQALVGAVVRLRIAAGEPVTQGRFIKPGDRGFLAAVLEPGMRAVSVPVTATSGVAGLVFPGDRVDLILAHALKDDDNPNAMPRQASETVLTDVRVLAVDQTTNDQDNKPLLAKTITFEVTPKQVEVIDVAAELGKLSLSLRSLAHQGDNDFDARLRGPSSVSHTWDSDVSPLIAKPGTHSSLPNAPPVVTILRGEAASGGHAPSAPTPPPAATAEGAPKPVQASTGVN
ncbi:MAG TPA: Flp pilus assembly protein CpaB [Alphaproteobacteria bacterium]|jgi:pilus assembly protein CpaB|nr:Flp pilus assembly protein CpaB [Alphaproteobacteria bacterium]